jgi:hypothetical protein
MHMPPESHVVPVLHVPHDPPQPSGPHVRPVHIAVQMATQWPLVSHLVVLEHVPQLPPQPSPPHARPVQFATHVGVHAPDVGLHVCPAGQLPPSVPQARPHESEPQTREPQLASHVTRSGATSITSLRNESATTSARLASAAGASSATVECGSAHPEARAMTLARTNRRMPSFSSGRTRSAT